MEVYNEVENDAGDAYPYDATIGTARHEHDGPDYNMQMVRHIEEEDDADRGDLIDMGVFKSTSGNATKRLRMRQEMRATTRTSKTAEATLKEIATQEFQAEKGKMQIWKQMIMQEVAQELQSVKESAEAQQVEIEILKRQLEEMDVKSETLERELGFLRAKEHKSGQHPGKHAPGMKNQAQPTRKRKNPIIQLKLLRKKCALLQPPEMRKLPPRRMSAQQKICKNKAMHRSLPPNQRKLQNIPGHRWYTRTKNSKLQILTSRVKTRGGEFFFLEF